MAIEYGFVYFLSNPSMPGIVKIGHTQKHPQLRATEISRATGCPEQFEILAYFGCENPRLVEVEIHRSLDRLRQNMSREFFRIDVQHVSDLIAEHFDFGSDAIWRKLLDGLIACDDYARKNK